MWSMDPSKKKKVFSKLLVSKRKEREKKEAKQKKEEEKQILTIVTSKYKINKTERVIKDNSDLSHSPEK